LDCRTQGSKTDLLYQALRERILDGSLRVEEEEERKHGRTSGCNRANRKSAFYDR